QHGEISHPLLDICDLPHGRGILGIRGVVEHVGQMNNVGVVVLAFIGVLLVTRVLAWVRSSVKQTGVGPGAGVEVAVWIVREVVGRPIAVAALQEVVGAVLVGIGVTRRLG